MSPTLSAEPPADLEAAAMRAARAAPITAAAVLTAEHMCRYFEIRHKAQVGQRLSPGNECHGGVDGKWAGI